MIITVIPRHKINLSEDWMILVFLLMLALVAWIRASYPHHFRRLFNSLGSERMMRQSFREETSTKRENLLFFLNFYLSCGMMLYLAHTRFSWSFTAFTGITLFLFYGSLVLVFFTLKSLVIIAVRFLSESDSGLEEYHYNVYLMNRITGLFLVPFTILAAYLDRSMVPWILFSGFGIYGIFAVFGLFRGIRGAVRSGVEVFYIFFYICTLEILPLLLLYKALIA